MKTRKKETVIWSFDTEDDSKGNIYLLNFFDGSNHYTFKNRDDAINFLYFRAAKIAPGKRIQIWATNLGYDIANLTHNRKEFISLCYAGSRVISGKIDNDLVFYDTLNHWKISVAEMGKRIGLEKLDNEGDFNNIEYCRRDCEITHGFVTKMKEKYDSIGAKLKATIGSTSLQYYYDTTPTTQRPFKNKFTPHELQFMQKGLYGGRTEAFFNKPIKDKLWCYDVNSLYPSVMHDFQFPILEKRRFTKKPNLKHEGIIHARVTCPVSAYLPYLPCRTDNTLFFPVGTFDTHTTYFELREAVKIGYKIEKVYNALEFTAGKKHFFKDFIATNYKARLIAQENKDQLLSDTFKLIMNNLFGKFGQDNEKTELIRYSPGEALKYPFAELLDDNWMLCRERGDYPPHTNFIWAAYVTAYARHRLFEYAQKVIKDGGQLLYCDTDSLFFKSEHEIITDSKKLGEFKLEGIFAAAYFKGLKNYRLTTPDGKNHYKVRGIPRKLASEFFETGRATIRKPYKMREVIRRNASKNKKKTLIPNFWDDFVKENRKKYDKRQVLNNGDTRPISF